MKEQIKEIYINRDNYSRAKIIELVSEEYIKINTKQTKMKKLFITKATFENSISEIEHEYNIVKAKSEENATDKTDRHLKKKYQLGYYDRLISITANKIIK